MTNGSTYGRLYVEGLHCVDSIGGVNMDDKRLGNVEAMFAEIIWKNEPLSSGELVKLCEKELKWKKSTTYTVLKRLCDHGIFKNEQGTVTSVVSKKEYFALQSEKFVDETFGGSLPAFVAAFTSRKQLSEDEISALKSIINKYEEV